MRILKLVIWDLDETILKGILEEGDEQIEPEALKAIKALHERGVLQAIASQNPSQPVKDAVERFGWTAYFNRVEADLGPKVDKVKRIIEQLEIDERDTAFIDEDPFERDSLETQTSHITSWKIDELNQFISSDQTVISEESQQRPRMYQEEAARRQDEDKAEKDYERFLESCAIRISIRSYQSSDYDRVRELLTRTHRMNLGVLLQDEMIERLESSENESILVAEMSDRYGDMGRCGVLYLKESGDRTAIIESLAISCRTRARGLSLALFTGMLQHPAGLSDEFICKYQNNGSNRPLRMLLMAAGFKPLKNTNQLVLSKAKLEELEHPSWIRIELR